MKRTLTILCALCIVWSGQAQAQEEGNRLDQATLTASCSDYSLTVSGSLVGGFFTSALVEYSIDLTPAGGGDAITVLGDVQVEADLGGAFQATVTGFLDLSSGMFTVSGTAVVEDGNTIDIVVFEPASGQLDCGGAPSCSARLGDFVWQDLDDDGEQGISEPGLAGVEIELLAGDGTLLAVSQSDIGGTYTFEGLCAGEYSLHYVESSVPAGFGPTLSNAAVDQLDSDPNGLAVTLLTDDTEDVSIDFGFAVCEECDGGVTALSLRFEGAAVSFVEAIEKDGDVLFAGLLAPGEVFSVFGLRDDGKIEDLNLIVDGTLDVEELHLSCSQPIGPNIVVGQFVVDSGSSRHGGLMCPLVACAAEANDRLDIDDDKVKLKITNTGDAYLTIERITFSWPAEYGNLKEIKHSGDSIYKSLEPPTSVVIDSGWRGQLKDRQTKPGKTETLELKFDSKFKGASEEDFSLLVEFAEGCSVEFVPGVSGGGGDFGCNKPLDVLAMIWDGTVTIDVLAWKGSPGSELLADVRDIAVGTEVMVSGFAGSPNDVYWEVFSVNGMKLGDSTFHMSCSDDDMDGPEDCGKREGDGKGNDSSRINDWLLEGMVDDQGTLDCTP